MKKAPLVSQAFGNEVSTYIHAHSRSKHGRCDLNIGINVHVWIISRWTDVYICTSTTSCRIPS